MNLVLIITTLLNSRKCQLRYNVLHLNSCWIIGDRTVENVLRRVTEPVKRIFEIVFFILTQGKTYF